MRYCVRCMVISEMIDCPCGGQTKEIEINVMDGGEHDVD